MGYPYSKFECKCGTELFLTLVNNSSTLSQKILALYPQIHQSRWMGDAPTACMCGRMQLACKDVPSFSSLSSLAGLKSFVSGKSLKLHRQLPPPPGLSGVSLVIGCFCLALHVAASLLELSAFCFPRIHPPGSVLISGSFFMLGNFKQGFIELETCF